MDTYRLVLLVVDPPLVVLQIHLLRIIYCSKKKELNGPYYAFYTSTAISAILHRVAEYYAAVVTALKIVDYYPFLAKLSLYLQFGGFVAIALGTCLISLNRLTAVLLALRYAYSQIWQPKMLHAYIVTQNVLAYAHCLPVLFSRVSFIPAGEYMFIAIPEDLALAMKLMAVISGVLVILVCCPSSAASAILIAKRKNYQRIEKVLAYSSIALFLVFALSCVDQILIYYGRVSGNILLSTIGLTLLHYCMDVHMIFSIAAPLFSHRYLREQSCKRCTTHKQLFPVSETKVDSSTRSIPRLPPLTLSTQANARFTDYIG